MQCQGDAARGSLWRELTDRRRDAAGTRRHLSNNNNKQLRKEGRGTKTHVSFPPSCHPFHIP